MSKASRGTIPQTAFLVAAAAALQTAESLLPHPVPGVRLGLANLVTLIALDRLGFRAAMEVAILRTLLSALLLGTLLSPTFILSFGAAVASTAAMGGLYRLASLTPRPPLSLIGVSVGGAAVHNLTQLALAYLLLLRYEGLFLLLPVLGVSAVVTGGLTGWLAAAVCQRLATAPALPATDRPPAAASPPDPALRRAGVAKLAAALLASVLVLVARNAPSLLGLLAILLAAALGLRASAAALARRLLRMLPLLLGAFLVPLFSVRSGQALDWGPLTLYSDGVLAGGLVALRLALLLVISGLLAHGTSPPELVAGLQVLLRPTRLLGLSPEQMAATLGAAWQLMPALLGSTRRAVRRAQEQTAQHGARAAVVEAVTDLYRDAECGSDLPAHPAASGPTPPRETDARPPSPS